MKIPLASCLLFIFSLFTGVTALAQVPSAAPAPAPTPTLTAPALPASSSAPADILFVLDASGSMEALVGGRTQMDIAKQSIRETLPGIPATTPVGLRVYAHRIPKTDKENSCKDTELVVPMEAGNAPKIDAAIQALAPRGYTPIAISLRAAAEDFRARESQHVVILLSDGEETCGGDPVAEAKNLLAQGFKVNIHTIGFRVDEKTRAQLKAISDATGGAYYDASDAASLTQNLKAATQKALFLDKPREDGRGQEIRGGSQFADAVKIEKDIEYHLDHHQRLNEYDYFYVEAKKGQLVTVSAMTLGHGVAMTADNQGRENTHPYNGFKIVDESFKEVGQGNVIGQGHAKASDSVSVMKDQKIYVLIGSVYDPVHKESPFKVEIRDLFDGGSMTDAGDDITQALEIQAGEYPKNYLQQDGDHDWYKVPVKAGETYEVKSLPEGMDLSVNLEVMDTNRVRLAGSNSPNGGALARIDQVSIPEDGYLYVHVHTYGTKPVQGYSLAVTKKASAASPTKELKTSKPDQPSIAGQTKDSPVMKKGIETGEEEQAPRTGLMNHPTFLKALLVLSVLGNLALGVMLLIAKLKKPRGP